MTDWILTVHISDYWRSDHLTFEEKRDGIVARFRNSRWRKVTCDQAAFDRLINVLAAADNAKWFDEVMDLVWDLADEEGIWIETHAKAVQL